MTLYIPGEYHIYYFNEAGAKRERSTAKSYGLARADADAFEKEHPTCSTSIMLVMYNSRVIHDKWGTDLPQQKDK